MQSSLEFRTNNVLPLMNIDKATYGHPYDNQKVFYSGHYAIHPLLGL